MTLPAQRHLAKLEDCEQCKALQYLVLRERKLSVAICLLHIKKGKQNLRVLTLLKKSSLKFHDQSQARAREGDSLNGAMRDLLTQALRLVTESEKCHKE